MSLLGMPVLILNLGSEMLYILDQRLRAQQIDPEKATKVLQDVVMAMFSQEFIAELFTPQPLYTNLSARQIFDRLAHSSIMRLSTSSMDKLYDLMTMGLKYQLLACSHSGTRRGNHFLPPSSLQMQKNVAKPRLARGTDVALPRLGEILDITMNHLLTVQSMITEAAGINAVQSAITLAGQCYSNCTPADFRLLRQTLCNFFQNKKVSGAE
jgi:hypothetical protein